MSKTSQTHHTHAHHDHQHGPDCGHLRVEWLDQSAYLHDDHLHRPHEGHWDEAAIPVSDDNPATCKQIACNGHHADLPMVPHGDHMDEVVQGRLHHQHQGHCDDHGPVRVRR